MNMYKITSIERDAFTAKITTDKGRCLCVSNHLVHDAHVGDIVCEYVTKDEGVIRWPMAYSCNGNIVLQGIPRSDYAMRNFVARMSRTEQFCFNVGLSRALIKKRIMPSISIANNLRLFLASNMVNIL